MFHVPARSIGAQPIGGARVLQVDRQSGVPSQHEQPVAHLPRLSQHPCFVVSLRRRAVLLLVRGGILPCNLRSAATLRSCVQHVEQDLHLCCAIIKEPPQPRRRLKLFLELCDTREELSAKVGHLGDFRLRHGQPSRQYFKPPLKVIVKATRAHFKGALN